MKASVPALLSVTLLLGLLPSLSADTLTWIGVNSSDWSDSGNWSSDGANTIPTSGDTVVLNGAGAFSPTNLDIAGLSINGLHFDGAVPLPDGFTLTGEQFTLTDEFQITNANPPSAVTWTIANEIDYATTSSAAFQNNVTLVLDGVVSGTGRVGKNNGGTIVLNNPNNTFEGGVNANQGTIKLNTLGSAGAVPAAFDSDFLRSNFAALWFSAENGYTVYDLAPTMGIDFGGGGNFRVDNDTELFLNTADTNGGRFGITGGAGKVHVNAVNNFDNKLNFSSGLTIMNNAGAFDGALSPVDDKAEFRGGTLDLNGFDLTGRNLNWATNSGQLGSGSIVNTRLDQVSTITGNIDVAGTGSGARNFGGPGDIILTGDILASSSTVALSKQGTGTLTLRGGHTLAADRETEIVGGALVLDYLNGSADAKLTEDSVRIRDADIVVLGSSSAPTTVTFKELTDDRADGGPTLSNSNGSSSLLVETNGQDVTVNIGGFKIDNKDTFNFAVDESNGGTATINSTASNESNGFLKANVTFNGTDFAKIDGGQVVALAPGDYLDAGATGDLASTAQPAGTSFADPFVNITNSFTTQDPGNSDEIAIRGLRFNENQATTLTLHGDIGFNRTGTAGVLVTANVGANDTVITGGELDTQFNSEFVVHQYNTQGVLQIDSKINQFSAGTDFSKTGAGEVILTNSGNQIGSNFNIFDGTVTVTDIGAIGTPGTFLLGDQATFNYNSADDASLTSAFLLRGDGTLKVSGAGKLTVDTTIDDRESAFHTLTLDGTGTGEITGDIDINYGGVRKTGGGVWIVGGTQTYRGDTIIEAGTLQANGDFYADSDFIVENSGAINGTGTIAGKLNLNDGSRIGPGASVGELTAGNTTFSGVTTFDWEVNNFGLGAGVGHDLLSVNGTIDLTGSTEFNINVISEDGNDAANWDAFSAGQWLLATSTEGILGFDGLTVNIDTSQFTNGTSGGAFSLVQDGDNLALAFAPIPEPGSFLLLLLAGLGFTAFHRRRRSRSAQ